ncbi:hypothetical protein [Streptomyces hoynatensis]|nr:hypothetical protein [Streptomyces hoynatensis]
MTVGAVAVGGVTVGLEQVTEAVAVLLDPAGPGEPWTAGQIAAGEVPAA